MNPHAQRSKNTQYIGVAGARGGNDLDERDEVDREGEANWSDEAGLRAMAIEAGKGGKRKGGGAPPTAAKTSRSKEARLSNFTYCCSVDK